MLLTMLLILTMITLTVYLLNKIQQLNVNSTGIPISLTHQIFTENNSLDPKQYYFCLSLNCATCLNIIEALITQDKYNKTYIKIVITDTYDNFQGFLKFNNLEIKNNLPSIITNINEGDLFLQMVPFVYLTNNEGVIVNKKGIKSLRETSV